MKTLALLCTLALAAPASAGGLAIGDATPMTDVVLHDVGGKDVTLAGLKGRKGLLVVFTCNHCPWAQAWQERIAALGNDALRRGLGVVAVNPNDPAAYAEDAFAPMVERAKRLGLEFPYAVDATSRMARRFGATHTPEAFLFDARGRLVYHGAVDDNAKSPGDVQHRWLKDAVDAVIDGRAVPVAETRSLGCSIKFRAGAQAADVAR